MRCTLLCIAILAALVLPAPGATILFLAPPSAVGTFDVIVEARYLFAGRDPLTDAIVSYGFNVAVSNPLVFTFDGADSGPLFDPAGPAPGTDVFAGASGLGIFPGTPEPLILATLHFTRIGAGPADITISSDVVTPNPFQGLVFLNEVPSPAEEIAATITVADVPEPATLGLAGAVLVALGILRRRLQAGKQ